jgi:hypothetical protein
MLYVAGKIVNEIFQYTQRNKEDHIKNEREL